MMPPLFAPQIDAVIENLKSDPDLMNQKIHQGLRGIYTSFCNIKPFGDKLIFAINNQEQPPTEVKSGWNLEFLENFVHWLAEKIVKETSRFKINPIAYNQYIQQNLPWAKRYGRIKRQERKPFFSRKIFEPGRWPGCRFAKYRSRFTSGIL